MHSLINKFRFVGFTISVNFIVQNYGMISLFFPTGTHLLYPFHVTLLPRHIKLDLKQTFITQFSVFIKLFSANKPNQTEKKNNLWVSSARYLLTWF